MLDTSSSGAPSFAGRFPLISIPSTAIPSTDTARADTTLVPKLYTIPKKTGYVNTKLVTGSSGTVFRTISDAGSAYRNDT